jgi:glutamate racemase
MTRIGIFDSGVGGLSVVRAIKRLMPEQAVIYFGDTARTPYGTKSQDTLQTYARENMRFLQKQGADLIVIACHSAASAVIESLDDFPTPVFEVVSPSINEALHITKRGRIGIIGTRATIASGIYEKRLPLAMPEIQVFTQACPLLVPLVEEGWFKARETRMIVKKYLRPLKNQQIDTLVLACTHYPLIKKLIQEKAGKRIAVVDPSELLARQLASWIRENRQEAASATEDMYFMSDLTPATEKIVQYFMGKRVKIIQARL